MSEPAQDPHLHTDGDMTMFFAVVSAGIQPAREQRPTVLRVLPINGGNLVVDLSSSTDENGVCTAFASAEPAIKYLDELIGRLADARSALQLGKIKLVPGA